MTNLELYRIFYEVAINKNITKASSVLNISQPAVTKHIKNLEDSLGEVLFIRTKRGVVLTEVGNKLFLKVKQALSIIDDVELSIKENKNLHNTTIRVGISTTLAKIYLMDYIDKFHKEYPNIIFDIYTDSTADLIKKLKVGEIDFIISKFQSMLDFDLNYNVLGKTDYIFVRSPKYKIKGNKIDIKDLEKYPILLQKYPSNSRVSADKYFKDNNINIKPLISVASSNLLTSFVKIGYGIGYVTRMYVDRFLKDNSLIEVKVNIKPPSIKYGIITLKNNTLSQDISLFINSLLDYRKVID